jgi:hypothetical protein
MEKDADGLYRSAIGNFRIKLPTTPAVNVLDQQIGLEKFKVYGYQAIENRTEVYRIEYLAIPETLLEMSESTGGYNYDTVINNLFIQYKNQGFVLSSTKEVTHKDMQGVEYRFDSDKGSIVGRFFKVGNKTYTLYFLGQPYTNRINAFFDSFEILKE